MCSPLFCILYNYTSASAYYVVYSCVKLLILLMAPPSPQGDHYLNKCESTLHNHILLTFVISCLVFLIVVYSKQRMFNPYLDTISSNRGATNFDLCSTTVVKVLYCFNTCCDTSTLILNKRPMGHIAHLKKQLTYDYIIMLINRRKKTLLS